MGDAARRRELSGVGEEAHVSVSQIMERAWKLHRKNGHPGVCWGPTLDELAQAREYVTSQKMKAIANAQRDSAPAKVEAPTADGETTPKRTAVRSKRQRAE